MMEIKMCSREILQHERAIRVLGFLWGEKRHVIGGIVVRYYQRGALNEPILLRLFSGKATVPHSTTATCPTLLQTFPFTKSQPTDGKILKESLSTSVVGVLKRLKETEDY